MIIRPFNQDDWRKFIGHVFVKQCQKPGLDRTYFIAGWCDSMHVGQGDAFVTYQELAREYVFMRTGKPAGVRVKG